jgi:formiminoglutamate deiminase
MMAFWCEHAWLGGEAVTPGVLLTVDGDRIAAIDTGVTRAPADAISLRGLTLPGLANVHSHAFHRALRGRTHDGGGTFWTWRDQMYADAAALTPDNYHRLARATFAEMAQAGVTVVGEFHYVHHQPDGRPYDDANAMADAVVAAAREAGLRLTLLDVVYLHGGLGPGGHLPLRPEQLRFSDGTVERWYEHFQALTGDDLVRIGAAVHSVRAVDPDAIEQVAAVAARSDAVLHAHVSEQPAENEQCVAVHGCSPTELLGRCGAVSPRFTAVHATHLTGADVALLGSGGAGVCVCPTTERDLADGIGPSVALVEAETILSVGSDSHAVIDLFEEARGVEMHQRLARLVRGNLAPRALLATATENGYRALGWTDGGRLEPGALADFVTVGLDSVRLAGTDAWSALGTAVFAATADDVHHVVVGGKVIVRDGRHVSIDVAGELRESIARLHEAAGSPT